MYFTVMRVHCCVDFSLVVVSRGSSPVMVQGLLIVASVVTEHGLSGAWPSAVVAPRLESTGLAVMVHGLSCSMAQGSSWIRDETCVSCTGRWILYHGATREDPHTGAGNFIVAYLIFL